MSPPFAGVGIFLSWTFLSKRLRRHAIAANNAVTIPEVLEVRFGDATGMLRAVAGAVTLATPKAPREVVDLYDRVNGASAGPLIGRSAAANGTTY